MIPLVSICLPSLNTRPFLEERMETIFSQTVTDWELIVCDSYSDDKSWEFFQKFKADKRVRLFQVPREGLYAGWNECLRRVRGEYVYIATSDDTMQPTLLECLLVPLGRLPEVDIALCDYDEFNEHGQPIARGRRFSDQILGEWIHIPSVRSGQTEFLLHMCSVTLWITMNSLLFRRRLLGRVGHFTTKFGSFGDVDWTLRSSLATDIAWVPQSLAGFRRHEGQATPQIFPYGPAHWNLLARVQRSVLRDECAGIPPLWKTMPHWEKQLLAYCRSNYLWSLRLNRQDALRNPREFLAHCWDGARQEPRWLLSRVLQVLGVSGEDEINPVSHAREVIKFFKASWPPKGVENRW
jgi:glycosyltransferase involved in cell wall biosynthesis